MKRKCTVLFQGDSITDAGRNYNAEVNSVPSLGPGYSCRIAGRLTVDHPEIEWTVYNKGISGHRVVDLYARWKVDAINLAPDVLSILIGINDTWHAFNYNNGVEVPRYERIYREMLTWTKTALPNVKLVLLEPYLLPAEDKLAWFPEVNERREVVARLAEEFQAVFVPLQSIFDEASKRAPWQTWSADGVHPSYAGHQLIADAWVQATKKFF
ncbi:MAG: SGNH/GDSL hydrolase family protein [Victivallaceae bacterium]|nr:SGNH/GDSL hydrolase family protein [Victivallaceae bacterium]